MIEATVVLLKWHLGVKLLFKHQCSWPWISGKYCQFWSEKLFFSSASGDRDSQLVSILRINEYWMFSYEYNIGTTSSRCKEQSRGRGQKKCKIWEKEQDKMMTSRMLASGHAWHIELTATLLEAKDMHKFGNTSTLSWNWKELRGFHF